jgi:FkbM family methyltransferase
MRFSLKDWLRQRREPWSGIFYRAFRKWRADGMELKRMDLPCLGPHSVVFDMGGFKGNWAADIHRRYRSQVHVFEPHPRFATEIAERFRGNTSIRLHGYALGSATGSLTLSDDGDASSSLRGGLRAVTGRVEAVRDFFLQQGHPVIDLMKINIEGGEFDLLPALDEAGVLNRIRCLQVQFHLFAEADIARREAIRSALQKTHVCDWSYEFVWEQWSLIPASQA